VDPFVIVLIAALAGLVLWVWFLGRHYPGSGLEQLGLRSAREIIETREALDAEDLQQMLDAHNVRRRARGEVDLTENDLELRVREDISDQQRRRAKLAEERRRKQEADHELDQLLDATNARRRARGLAERSRADAREEFDPDSPS
jgi:hypothetical protein